MGLLEEVAAETFGEKVPERGFFRTMADAFTRAGATAPEMPTPTSSLLDQVAAETFGPSAPTVPTTVEQVSDVVARGGAGAAARAALTMPKPPVEADVVEIAAPPSPTPPTMTQQQARDLPVGRAAPGVVAPVEPFTLTSRIPSTVDLARNVPEVPYRPPSGVTLEPLGPEGVVRKPRATTPLGVLAEQVPSPRAVTEGLRRTMLGKTATLGATALANLGATDEEKAILADLVARDESAWTPNAVDRAVESVVSIAADPVTMLAFLIGQAPGAAAARALGGALAKKYGAETAKQLAEAGFSRAAQQAAARQVAAKAIEPATQAAMTSGGFASFEALHNALDQGIAMQRGQQKEFEVGQLAERAGKGAVTGAALGTAMSLLTRPLLKFGAEVGVFASVPSLVEGQTPTPENLLDAGLMVVGFRMAGGLRESTQRALAKPVDQRTPPERQMVDNINPRVKAALVGEAVQRLQALQRTLGGAEARMGGMEERAAGALADTAEARATRERAGLPVEPPGAPAIADLEARVAALEEGKAGRAIGRERAAAVEAGVSPRAATERPTEEGARDVRIAGAPVDVPRGTSPPEEPFRVVDRRAAPEVGRETFPDVRAAREAAAFPTVPGRIISEEPPPVRAVTEVGPTEPAAAPEATKLPERAELKPAPATFLGWQQGIGDQPSVPWYNLTEDIPGHPKGSTVGPETLREAGFEPPPPVGEAPPLAQPEARPAAASVPVTQASVPTTQVPPTTTPPTEPLLPVATGRPGKFKTARGTEVETTYALVDRRQLIASHGLDLEPNPAYPQEIQPRDRTRAASEQQITENIARFDPEKLAQIVVGPDGVVESGNGRDIMLGRIYEGGEATAEQRRRLGDYLAAKAAQVGIEPSRLLGVEQPVIVEVRQTPVDRAAFAREANEVDTARMSATEQAQADAERMGDLMGLFQPSETGQIVTPQNREFVRAFLRTVPAPAEVGALVGPTGEPSQALVARIRNAVFARAYGDSLALERMAESTDDNTRNISAALLTVAPRWAKLREAVRTGDAYAEADLTTELMQAVNRVSALRDQGMDIQTHLAHGDLFGEDPIVRELLDLLSKHGRSAKRLSALLGNVVDVADALGSPNQAELVQRAAPKKDDLLEAAAARMERDYGEVQPPPARGRQGVTEAPAAYTVGAGAPEPPAGAEAASAAARPAEPSVAPRATAAQPPAGLVPLAETPRETAEGMVAGPGAPRPRARPAPRPEPPRVPEAPPRYERTPPESAALARGGLFVTLGDQRYPVESLEDASRRFREVVDQAGTGASRTPTPRIVDGEGRVIGYLSYNGRVWAGEPKDWKPGQTPLYDPRGPRYEQTPLGEQAVIPGVAPREVPKGPTRAEVPQRPVEELPLLGGAEAERRAAEEQPRLPGVEEPKAPYESRPTWADEFESVGGRIEPDGSVLLYHATTREKAAQILRDGVLRRPSDAPDTYGIYLSSSETVARDYGDGTVVPVRVRASDLQPDDVFPGRRMDFSASTTRGVYTPIAVGDEAITPRLPGVAEPPAEYEAEPAPPFYSALLRAAEAKVPPKARPEQVLGVLRNTPGVKPDEMKWTGLDLWLADKTGTVTRQEVVDFLRENRVEVREVVLGERGRPLKWRDMGQGLWRSEDPEMGRVGGFLIEKQPNDRFLMTAIPNGPRHSFETFDEAVRQAEEYRRNAGEDVRLTKFRQYVLPGGQPGTYRELLLTLPVDVERSNAIRAERVAELVAQRDALRAERASGTTPERQDDIERQIRNYETQIDMAKTGERIQGAYRGGHFDEPNVLAHVRFDGRTDADGKKVLFIEEIQSDWHQEGRRKGYTSESDRQRLAELTKEHESLQREARMLTLSEEALQRKTQAVARLSEVVDEMNAIHDRTRGGIPEAPFAKTWHELALKRVLRYAAEHGYDRVAWTTGEQQAERYDLSKHVLRVEYEPKSQMLRAIGKDGEPVIEREVPPEKVEDYIGKDVAAKLLQTTPRDRGLLRMGIEREIRPSEKVHSLAGLDLKVGGEGMRGFYDKMVPDFLNKYGKRWGAKVGEANIGRSGYGVVSLDQWQREHGEFKPSAPWNKWLAVTPDGSDVLKSFPTESLALEYARSLGESNALRVPAIDVTPSMKQSVMTEGQALFEPRGGYRPGTTPEQKRIGRALVQQLDLFNAEPARAPKVEMEAKRLPGEQAGAGMRTLGRAIAADFKETGRTEFRGKELRTAQDLAVMGQVVRNPNYETFWTIYTKYGKVVAAEALTARIPGVAPAHLDAANEAKTFVGMKARMARLGADGYWLMHNHPSGASKPSRSDISLSQRFAEKVEGFKGHVVIDSGEYSLISGEAMATFLEQVRISREARTAKERNAARADASFFEPTTHPIETDDAALRTSLPHTLLGVVITDPAHVRALGKQIERPDGWVAVIHRGGTKGEVRGVQIMPEALFENTREAEGVLRGQRRAFGAAETFTYSTNPQMRTAAAQLIRRGAILDHATADKPTEREYGAAATVGEERVVPVRVREPEAPYSAFEMQAKGARRTFSAEEAERFAEELRRRGLEAEVRPKAGAPELRQVFARARAPERAAAPPASPAEAQRAPLPERAEAPPARPASESPFRQPDVARASETPPTPTAPPEMPRLREPILALANHQKIVRAAENLFLRAGVERDTSKRISDQITDLMVEGRLRVPDVEAAAAAEGLSLAELGAAVFRPDVTHYARALGMLGQLAKAVGKYDRTPEGRRALDELARAATDVDETLKAMSWWRRLDNVRRGLMVAQLATSMRNFESQVARLGVDVLDQGLQRGLQAMFRTNATAHPTEAFNALLDVFRSLKVGTKDFNAAKREADAILELFPKTYHDRLFGTYMADLSAQAPEGGFASAADRAMAGAERGVQVLNTVNRFQEYVIRGAVFQAELRAQLAQRGMSLEQFLQARRGEIEAERTGQQTAGYAPVAEDILKPAIKRALELTFAENPAYGSLGYRWIQFVNALPGVFTLVVPFPRFMTNALRFYYEFSPVGFGKLLGPSEWAKMRQGDFQAMSRAVIGSAMLGAAYMLRDSEWAGERWYEFKLPDGRTVDVRPLNPFAIYLFAGELMRRVHEGTLYKTNLTELVSGLAGVNLRAGAGLYVLDQLARGLVETGTPEELGTQAVRAVSLWVSSFLVPNQTLIDALGQFRPEAAVVRSQREEALGPVKAKVPFLAETLPEAASPTSAEPVRREAPLARQLTGATVRQEKNSAERELDRLQFDRHEILASTGNPTADRLLAEQMGPLVEERLVPYVESAAYAALPDAKRAEEIGKKLKPIRALAKNRAEREDPALFAEIKAKRMPARRRAVLEEQGIAP